MSCAPAFGNRFRKQTIASCIVSRVCNCCLVDNKPNRFRIALYEVILQFKTKSQVAWAKIRIKLTQFHKNSCQYGPSGVVSESQHLSCAFSNKLVCVEQCPLGVLVKLFR